MPLIPDYDGQIWDGPRTFAALGTYHRRDTKAAYDDLDYDYCYVNGVWKAGYKHPTRHAICIDRELTTCFTCESDFAQPCSEWCNQQAKECRQGDLACASACLGFDFGAFTSPEAGNQFIACYNQCIGPIMRGACASCKNCRVSNPRCPYCLTSYLQLREEPPLPRDPRYDPNHDYCSEEIFGWSLRDVKDIGDAANYCCFVHDDCYGTGGVERNREVCDEALYSCLRAAWLGSEHQPWEALAYYLAVRAVGWWSRFNYKRSKPSPRPPYHSGTPMQDAFGSPWGHLR